MHEKLFESSFMSILKCGNLLYYKILVEELDEEIATELVESRRLIFDEPHFGIFDYQRLKKSSVAALKILASEKAYEHILGSAVTLRGEVGSLLGDIYYNINPPKYPSKYFSSNLEAFEWLTKNPAFNCKDDISTLIFFENDHDSSH